MYGSPVGLYLLPLFPLGFQSFGSSVDGLCNFLRNAGYCIQIIIDALDDIFTIVYLGFFGRQVV